MIKPKFNYPAQTLKNAQFFNRWESCPSELKWIRYVNENNVIEISAKDTSFTPFNIYINRKKVGYIKMPYQIIPLPYSRARRYADELYIMYKNIQSYPKKIEDKNRNFSRLL